MTSLDLITEEYVDKICQLIGEVEDMFMKAISQGKGSESYIVD